MNDQMRQNFKTCVQFSLFSNVCSCSTRTTLSWFWPPTASTSSWPTRRSVTSSTSATTPPRRQTSLLSRCRMSDQILSSERVKSRHASHSDHRLKELKLCCTMILLLKVCVCVVQALQYGSEDNSTLIVVPFGAWGKHQNAQYTCDMSRNFASIGRWS